MNLSAPSPLTQPLPATLVISRARSSTLRQTPPPDAWPHDYPALHRLSQQRINAITAPLADNQHTAVDALALQQLGDNAPQGLALLYAAQAGIAAALTDSQAAHTNTWMRLQPTHWMPARDHVRLHPLHDTRLSDDWAQLMSEFAAWFAERGWQAFTQGAVTYLRSPEPFDVQSVCIELAQMGLLEMSLPTGRDLRSWQTLLTEMQMHLHGHAVNQQRSQAGLRAINSVWLDEVTSSDSVHAISPAPWQAHAQAVAQACITLPQNHELERQADLRQCYNQLNTWAQHALGAASDETDESRPAATILIELDEDHAHHQMVSLRLHRPAALRLPSWLTRRPPDHPLAFLP